MSMMKSFKISSTFAAVSLIALAACAPAPTPAPAPTSAPAAPAPAATVAAAAPAPAATAVPAPTKAPAPTVAPAAAAPTAAPAAAPAGGALKEVPRNRTLVLDRGIDPIGLMNPWAAGYTHQALNAMLWEPLFYFGIFSDKEIPWLAESGTYNADFTKLTVKLRKEATWSDGTPVTAKDVKFTTDGQFNNEKLPYHSQFKTFYKDATIIDDKTIDINFNKPAPRFKFEVLTLKFDTGIPIVPAAVLSAQPDVTAFIGGLDMVHSGPYRVVQWTKEQKVLDLREDWWAVKAGIATVPDVKRILGIPTPTMEGVAQKIVNNELDASLDMRNALIASTLQKNPKITSHTGANPPHGYLDWWPNSLWFNHQLAPYNDVRVRKAMALTINRDQIDEVVYEGAKISTVYPFPLYPGMQKFADNPGMKALIEKYQPRKFDLAASAALMTDAGWKKNAKNLWEKDGKTVDATIEGFASIHSDIVPVLVEQLKKGGFDAKDDTANPDAYNNMAAGKPGLYMFGHGASLADPEAVLTLFTLKPSGNSAGNNNFSRYSNPDFDKLVNAMGPLAADDPKFTDLANQAFEIYYKDVIDIPIIQWLHRIPYNQTYWTNWPTLDNKAGGENGAYWAHTGLLVVTGLKAVQ